MISGNKIAWATAMIATTALTACGGSSNTSVSQLAIAATTVTAGNDVIVVAPNGSGGLDITVGGGTTAYVADAAKNAGGFDGFDDATNSVIAHYGESTSGSVSAAVATTTADATFSGATYERTAAGSVPVSGTAGYAGSYVGVLTDDASDVTANYVAGDVALTANFDSTTISGTITNRTGFSTVTGGSTATFADLTLNGGSISASGAFSGSASGGEILGVGGASASGTYNGLIAGAAADEAVGSVTLSHSQPGATATELGVFIAE